MSDKEISVRDDQTKKLLLDLGQFQQHWGEVGVVLSGSVVASDGVVIHPDSLDKSYTRDASGNITAITVTHWTGAQYKKTFTLTAGLISAESKWVAQ